MDHFFDNGYWLYQKLAEILPEDLVKRIVSIHLIKVSILKRLVETSWVARVLKSFDFSFQIIISSVRPDAWSSLLEGGDVVRYGRRDIISIWKPSL